MRRVLVLALLLLVPVTAAQHSALRLLHAELTQAPGTIVGAVDLNDHFVVTATIVNDWPATTTHLNVNEWWHLNDLPYTVWHGAVTIGQGEVQTITADVWLKQPPEWIPLFSHGPVWYCLEVGHDWTARCWSLMNVPGFPQGEYPENVPNWQLMGEQYGDGPQEP